ncbi:MAG: metallophosphoesterase [archaeon]
MKLLIIGDLHGRKPKIHFNSFDAIVCVGDFGSDKKLGIMYRKWFRYLKKNPDNTVNSDTYFIKLVGKRKFDKLYKDSLKDGRKILQFLNSFNKPVFIVPGNWDQSYGKTRIKDIDKDSYSYTKSFLDFYLGVKINSELTKGLKNVKSCQFKLHKYKGVNFIGYGLSSNAEEPFRKSKKRDFTKTQANKLRKTYNNIIKKLDKAYKKRDKKFPTIFITHNVPYGTNLDICLDKKSYAYKKHLGSTVARQFVSKHQPLLCAGGHIHEYFRKTKIRRTTVINAGFGSDSNIFIDIKKGKINKIQFYRRYKKFRHK